MLSDLELGTAPHHLESRHLFDGVSDALLFDAVAELGVFGHQLELELSAVVHREVNLPGLLAALTRLFGRGLDAVYGVHGGGILPRGRVSTARIIYRGGAL